MNVRAVAVTVGWAALVAAGPAHADYAEGWIKARAGEAAAAVQAWKAEADAGAVDLQYNLGVLYESGALGAPDYDRALAWYRRATDYKLGAAEVRLARLTYLGLGTVADPEAAEKLIQGAVKRGAAEAEYALGAALEAGRDRTQDLAKAADFYLRAADKGFGPAQYALGRLLANGLGTTKDVDAALGWYRAAAEQGMAGAENNLGYHYERGIGVAPDPVAAAAWYRKAAESGLPLGQVNYGICLRFGLGADRDDVAATRWFSRAAHAGDPQGQVSLGLAYANGLGLDADPVEAYAWFTVAGEGGDPAIAKDAARYRTTLAARMAADALSLAAVRAGELRRGLATPARADAPTLRRVDELGVPGLAVQRHLKTLGYYDGPVDGLVGSGTAAAIKTFQRARGLPPDGTVTAELLALLAHAARLWDPAWPRSRSPI